MKSWRQCSDVAAMCGRCLAHPPHFDRARAFGLYEGPLRQMIHALKYRRHQSLCGPLSLLMRQADDGLLAGADAVVPVPLHPWRRLRRGFNQSEVLARGLGRPIWRPLRRRSLGVPQAGLSADLREANVRDAYTLKRRWTDAGAGLPRRVVLIDDVMTTGATLEACSVLLRDSGVEWIGALTAARAATLSAPPAGATRPPQRPRALRLSAPRR